MALPATTLRVVYATVWDEAAPCGVSALSRRAALWQRRSASVLRPGTSPVLRTRRSLCPVRGQRPLSASGGDPRSRLMVKFFRRQGWSPAAPRAADFAA